MNEEFSGNKIHDAALKRLAEEKSPESVSVLVELDLPQQEVEVRVREGKRSMRMRPDAGQDQAASEAKVTEVKRFLEEVTGHKVIYLRAAKAFVAEATGEQLREVSRSPLVRAIHPNRRLR